MLWITKIRIALIIFSIFSFIVFSCETNAGTGDKKNSTISLFNKAHHKLSGFDIHISRNKVSIKSGNIKKNNRDINISGSVFEAPKNNELEDWKPFFIFIQQERIVFNAVFPEAEEFEPLYVLFTKHGIIRIVDIRDPVAVPPAIRAEFFGAGQQPGSDDTERINSALFFLKETGGILHLTGETYTVKGNIRIHSNTTLALSEKTRVVLAPDSDCNFIFGGEGVSNVRIKGGMIDANKGKQKKPLIAAIYSWKGSTDWVIEGVRIVNSQKHGIFMNGGHGFSIISTEVTGADGIGIAIFRSPGNIKILNSAVRDSNFIGLQIAGTNKIFTKEFSITGTEVSGANNSNLALSYVDGGTVSRSRFNDSKTQFGLLCDHCLRVDISNSTFNGNVAGVLLNYSSSKNTVIESLFSRNREDGLDVAYDGGNGNIIEANHFSENGIWGVYILSANENTISDNTFDSNGDLAVINRTHGAAIQIAGSSKGNIVKKNRFTDKKGVQTYNVFEGGKTNK